MGKATNVLSLFSQLIPQSVINKTYPLPKVSVFYHSVKQTADPISRSLYQTITPERFEQDLDYLLSHFGDALELSFDDGLSSCADVIAPILKRKGIPAIFFLNTAFIDNRALFFRYKAALIADACAKNQALLQKLQQQIKSPLLRYLYEVKYHDREQLDELAKQAEINFNDYLNQHQPYLNSSQIKSLIADGFLIGAHSIDHPPFHELEEHDQIYQIASSVNQLSGQFNLSYKYFSFPFTDWGLSARFFDQIYTNQLVDATWGCAGMKHDTHPKHSQRIALDALYTSARQAIKTEWLYYQLKQVIHKNTIRRF